MGTRGLRVLALSCLLAACSGTQDAGDAGKASCKLEQAAAMPVRVVQGGLLVPGAINGIPVQLELDTGASRSMVDAAVTLPLALPADPRATTRVRGTGGVVVTHNTRVQSLAIGGMEWQALSLTTARLARRYREDPPVAGLLGADRLSNFDVELDVPHGRFILWTVADCEGDFVPWTAPHFAVPLARHNPNRMIAPVEVDGHELGALIDWGAFGTVMPQAVAASLGVTAQSMVHDRLGTSNGVDQNQVPVRLHRFDQVRIGPEVFHNVGIAVSDIHIDEAGMLLGVDYLRTRRIWLSYATRQMFVMLPAPAAGAAP